MTVSSQAFFPIHDPSHSLFFCLFFAKNVCADKMSVNADFKGEIILLSKETITVSSDQIKMDGFWPLI